MLFLIFYLQYFVLGQNDPPISESAEVCVEGSKFCDYQEVKKEKQILRNCAKKHFSSKSNLAEWLLEEIFCIYDPLDKNKNDDENNNTDLEIQKATDHLKSIKSSKKQQIIQKANYPIKSDILSERKNINSETEHFYIPSPFLASSKCRFNIREINISARSSIDSLRCYYTQNNLTDIKKILDQSYGVVNPSDPSNSCGNIDSTKLESISYRFIYDRDSDQITRIQKYCKCQGSYTDPDDEIPLQINAHFYSQELDNDITKREIKSGEAGYSDGRPLIAFNTSTNAASHFPIPVGYDCSHISYTPLLFGYDTISGCTEPENEIKRGEIITNLKKYPKVAIMGKARGYYERDWTEEISGINEINEHCSNLQLIINYEYVGNTKNPQNKIYNASYTCRSTEGNQFLFVVNFLRSSDTSSKAFLPKPKGLPDDTFAPLIN